MDKKGLRVFYQFVWKIPSDSKNDFRWKSVETFQINAGHLVNLRLFTVAGHIVTENLKIAPDELAKHMREQTRVNELLS